MIIQLTKIEAHETKFTIETKYKDMVLWDYARSPEKAIRIGRYQVKLVNMFRRRENERH